MEKPKLIRITTVPLSLEKLLEGQLAFMNTYFEVIAVSSEKERLKAFAQREGVSYFFVHLTRKITPIQDSIAVYQLYRFLRKEKPHMVHTHTPKAGIVGMLAAWFARVPHRLHTVAGLPLMESSGAKKKLLVFIEKLTYHFATKVYPNSRGIYQFILKNKLCKESKLQIIGNGSSNGIDTGYFSMSKYDSFFSRDFRDELGIPQDNFVFIFVGRIVRDKGIIEMVEAFTELSSKKVSLLLVGPLEQDLDPLPNETLTAIEQTKNIITVGYQQDVRPYFAISDALVFPSYREGFPNVVLQALAMELPAIVSDINGCNEMVTHMYNGIIIPKKNKEALAHSMQLLISDKETYQKLKLTSRASIIDTYERKNLWEALLMEYQNLTVKDL